MVTIGVYQSLSNSALHKYICLGNINKLYKSYVKFDYQKIYKAIIEAAMVSIPGVFADNSPMSPGPYVTVKNPNASKSFHKFSGLFYVKKNLRIQVRCC